MSLATTFSRALLGIEAIEVRVETHLSNGLPGFAIVGLPETAVKESKERVRSAILNSGLEFPARRITVNLAPADIPKAGGRYDLAIALSILQASGQVSEASLAQRELLGELALDGSVRRVTGALPAMLAAQARQRRLVLPIANASELAMLETAQADCIGSLLELVEHFVQGRQLSALSALSSIPPSPEATPVLAELSQIRGQAMAKRALQIAAAGGHNLLFIGPPGSGKTLLARSLIGLLPDLTEAEAVELAVINSVAAHPFSPPSWRQRPLRSPHHSASAVALVGGGHRVSPGEISLAHRGVLFLDELPEFKPGVLDALREPLESREITVSRASYRVCFPANFQLLAAMNPCPCGYAHDLQRTCRCSAERIRAYMGKLSGPLLDRLDLMIEVPALAPAELLEPRQDTTDWSAVRTRVAACRERQLSRGGQLNCELGLQELGRCCPLTSGQRRLLAQTMERLRLSARSAHRVIKVARTIADYEGRPDLTSADLLEAISYRSSGPLNYRVG
jgi:magnesium chelatase family protein